MSKARSRAATGEWRILSVAIVSAFVASCTPINDPQSLGLTSPSLAGAEAGAAVSHDGAQVDVAGDGYAMSDDPAALSEVATLPDAVTTLPLAKPESPDAQGASAPTAETVPLAADATVSTSQAAQAAASDAQAQSAAAAGAQQETDQPRTGAAIPVPADHPVYVTATDPNQTMALAAPPKKKSFFASLFGTNDASAGPLVANEPKPKPVVDMDSRSGAGKQVAAEEKQAAGQADVEGADDEADVKVASLSPEEMASADPLPGVRKTALFEIKRKSGLDDDSDVDLHEDEDWGPVNVATAGGLARLAPNGLIKQTDQVDVACLKPSLVRVLKTVEGHYGKKVVVTSGYRSPARNRRARGAKNSLHMYCAAADIQVPGVTKWELASYFRTMPGRGGVGTYCHTESVHIDVGPERDWNWRCRRRR